MSKLAIERTDNGYLIVFEDTYVDEDQTYIRSEVIQDDDVDELKSGEALLWWIMDWFEFGGSKHDAERIRIVRVKRDAPEEP
jgi:hypothetical protein